MNLTDLLDNYSVPYRLSGTDHHVSGSWIGIQCPHCGPDSGVFHAAIHPDTLAANCWRCGRLWGVNLLARVCSLPHARVRDFLRRTGGIPTTTPQRITGRYKPPGGVLDDLGSVHRNYLVGRGFDPDQLVRLWGVGGIGPLGGMFAWRLYVPYQLDGKSVTWTTRSIRDRGLRYLSARPQWEDVPIRHIPYGIDYVRQSVVVCEGPTDVWRIGPGAVALGGLVASDQQLDRLRRVPIRYVCFDRDRPARKAADRLCHALTIYPGTTIRIDLDADDPGSAPPDEINQLRGEVFNEIQA